MCGLITIFGKNASKFSSSQQKLFLNSIAFRGRDDYGIWSDNTHITLIHSRLSILDINLGKQPMIDHNNRFVIVYNGEIYNYKELRKQYENLGSKFKTNSDTEVIIEGFKKKGEKVLHDLNGMFTFIIWDQKNKQLFIARDRLGKKPLYWLYYNDCYFFSSTIDSFRIIPEFDFYINKNYLNELKYFGSSISNQTIWQNIKSFPMASFLLLNLNNNGNFKPITYWTLNFNKTKKKSFSDYLDEYDEILTNSIKIRLRSDVPLCLTFSGGVDSGTIAAICAKKLNTNLNLFCIDYDTERDKSPELLQAKAVANHLDLDLNFIHYNYNNIFEDLKKYYVDFDQPCLQLALAYSAVLYAHINKTCKVTLSGNGADEIFTGYCGDERLALIDLFLRLLMPCTTLVPKLKKIFNPIQRVYRTQESEDVKYLKQKMLDAEIKTLTDLTMYTSLFYGARDSNFILPDIAGLSQQVEVRSPFLDYRLIEFAAKLPTKYKVKLKINNIITKYLPKIYYSRYVPNKLAFANKKGMGFNLNWHKMMAFNPSIRNMLINKLKLLSNYNIDASYYINEFAIYCKSMENNGVSSPQNSSITMLGVMLSYWLELNKMKSIQFISQ